MIALSGSGPGTKLYFSSSAELPAGLVSETYSAKNIQEPDRLAQTVRNCLNGKLSGQGIRAGMCLPDGIFRIQTLEFDTLPKKTADHERLIRWRLEKTAAFDLADTVLRYQVLSREDAGFTVLACVAKKSIIAEYEAVLTGLGMEVWSVGISSFSALNCYANYITRKSGRYALTHLTGESFATIVSENGGARFYRFKDIKRGSAGEIRSRLVREIDDSLHFYTHMDRSQQAGVGCLYLSGEPGVLDLAAGELRAATSLEIEVLSPGIVLSSAGPAGVEMAAALGAGKAL